MPLKKINTIVGNTSKEIINDIKNFTLNYKSIYTKLNIKFKRGYLLYGPPGTGKTSIIQAIATITKKRIYKISFNEKNMGDNEYKTLLNDVSNSIIVFDDINPDILKENGKIIKREENGMIYTVTYNLLLDFLDGISSNDNITIITTNHYIDIGSALLRAGRIDRKFKFDYATPNEIQEYFNLFYDCFNIPEEKIIQASSIFINYVQEKNKNVSFAELQQFLIKYFNYIDEMTDNIHEFDSNNKLT